MTYEEALSELRARYDAGERDIAVPRETYAAYGSGLLSAERSGPVTQFDDFLWFKAAKVRPV